MKTYAWGQKYVLVKMIKEMGHLTRIHPWVEDLVCNSNMLRRRIRKGASSLSSHLCNKIMMEGCKKAKKRPKFNRSKKFNTFTWLILVCSNVFYYEMDFAAWIFYIESWLISQAYFRKILRADFLNEWISELSSYTII